MFLEQDELNFLEKYRTLTEAQQGATWWLVRNIELLDRLFDGPPLEEREYQDYERILIFHRDEYMLTLLRYCALRERKNIEGGWGKA